MSASDANTTTDSAAVPALRQDGRRHRRDRREFLGELPASCCEPLRQRLSSDVCSATPRKPNGPRTS